MKELRDPPPRLPEPEVIGERCVHTRTHQASCQGCVDACPTDAWIIDDDRLGIDTERCDGCGLCAPACPEGAIAFPFSAAHYLVTGIGLAFAACDRAGVASGDPNGLLPCIHGLGVADLLRMHAVGTRRLILTRADCSTCPRGQVQRIDASLEAANAWLADRGLEQVQSLDMEPDGWHRALNAARGQHRTPALGRRAFFRNLATAAIESATERFERSHPEVRDFVPPGRLILGMEPGHLALQAPRIDGERCNGCDACAQLCCHDAIRIEPDHYALDADACTGCGLCVDICEQAAVSLRTRDPAPQMRLALNRDRCAACGLEFHTPRREARQPPRCQVCARTNHHRLLFQVLST